MCIAEETLIEEDDDMTSHMEDAAAMNDDAPQADQSELDLGSQASQSGFKEGHASQSEIKEGQEGQSEAEGGGGLESEASDSSATAESSEN